MIEIIADIIANLTPNEASKLNAYLKEKYGIEPPPESKAPQQVEVEEEIVFLQTEFAVILDGLADPTRKINVIKTVRELTGCGLAEGKILVESCPKTIRENIPKGDAELLAKKLEDSGARVTIR